MFRNGDQLGKYTLIEKLGSGAFGVVWLAESRTPIITTKVALKLPTSNLLRFEDFQKEAQLWVKASGHPNVVPIIEADIVEDQLLIASEYVQEGTLGDWIRMQKGRLPDLEKVIQLVTGILAGLDFLHTRGIVHRDIKPNNILLQGGTPRLTDFGISRAIDSDTQTNSTAGTVCYMAPEAFDGIRTVQTDIWAVGVILYQLLEGKLPFVAEDSQSLMKSIFFENFPRPERRMPILLSAILDSALAKDANSRYQSAAEMQGDLNESTMKFLLAFEPKAPIPQRSFRPLPRDQHYFFTYNFLRRLAETDGANLVESLSHETGSRYLSVKWVMVGPQARSPNEDLIPPDGIESRGYLIGDKRIAIARMPTPEGFVEAYFVAIVVPADAQPGKPCHSRYFTLECSPKRPNGTLLGEWGAGGSHSNLGDGPPPSFDEFLESLQNWL